MKPIKSLSWYTLSFATVIFCEIFALLFAFLFNSSQFTFEAHFEESFSGFVYATILIPILLVSLKVFKSYLVLSIFLAAAVLLRAVLVAYLVNIGDVTGSLGGKLIYSSGDITTLGWFHITINPLLVACLLSLLIFVKQAVVVKQGD